MYMGNQTLQAWQSDRREPCRAYLSPAYTVCLVEADIGMPGLKDAVHFPSDLIDHVAEAYFLMAARKVCSIRSRGVVRNAPKECSTSLPCCSGVKRSFAPGLFRHVCGIRSKKSFVNGRCVKLSETFVKHFHIYL